MAHEHWVVKDKKRLLLALADALTGDAHLSLEGDLRGFPLMKIAGASPEETAALRRNTSWPRQDFVVLPLDHTTFESVMSAIGGNVPRRILHVQIEKSGKLEFGAYDRFHPECIVFGPGVGRDVVEALVTQGILDTMAAGDRRKRGPRAS